MAAASSQIMITTLLPCPETCVKRSCRSLCTKAPCKPPLTQFTQVRQVSSSSNAVPYCTNAGL
eukprot:3795702-Rhodomonas_salina.2